MEKWLYEIDSVKYFGIQIGKNITWKQQIDHVAVELNKTNDRLSKLIGYEKYEVSLLCNI